MTLHDTDFFSWTQHQAYLLNNGDLSNIDVKSIAEELLLLGNSELSALESHFIIFMLHLLKQHYQPEKLTRSWQFSIKNSRNRIIKLIKNNPGMKNKLEQVKIDAYECARLQAAIETGLDEEIFPEEIPEWMREKIKVT